MIACSLAFFCLAVCDREDNASVARSSHCWVLALSSLLFLDVVAALVVGSLKLHLLLLAVAVAAPQWILRLLLLLPAFVMVDLLVSTMLSPTGRVWGGGHVTAP